MLTCQRLLRSRSELNSGTTHIFWYMMDEHMNFWCHPRIMCSHGSHELFLKCSFRVLKLRYDRKGKLQHDEALRDIQPVDEPMMEPLPSEKRCKRENIFGLQMITRDTPFLRCQADRQTVLLGSDFE